MPCAKCPKLGHGWCSIWGKRRAGTASSCAYGRKMMYYAYMAGYSAAVAGAEARQPEGMEKGARHGTA